MKLVAIMPVRNEAWVLSASLRAVLTWCDAVCVLDHASTDSSAEIIREIATENPGKVHFWHDDNPEWQEMRHRQFLLDAARSLHATHIATVDADEILSANLVPTVRNHLACLPYSHILQLPWVCLSRSFNRRYMEGVWFNNWVSTAFRDDPCYHWASRNGYDFHHRQPMGAHAHPFRPVGQLDGGLLHLQFVSARRLKAKQALYKMTETIRWPWRSTPDHLNNLYGRAVYESDPTRIRCEIIPARWWDSKWTNDIESDSTPWQEEECRKLMEVHGAKTFAGLDLFGVV